MTVLKCDRCGAVFEMFVCKMEIISGANHGIDSFDLCVDCHKLFQDFLKIEEEAI